MIKQLKNRVYAFIDIMFYNDYAEKKGCYNDDKFK